MKALDISGQRYGRLVVIKEVESSRQYRCWLCRCVCGVEKVIPQPTLRNGEARSCGCLRKQMNIKHGQYRGQNPTPERTSWSRMWDRCTNLNCKNYNDYGGRGISVCERWQDFSLFFEDIGPRPNSTYSLDRIDNDGNYEPANVRWASKEDQANNTRANRFITFQGKTLTLSQWNAELGLPKGVLSQRINGGKWSIERALTTAYDSRRKENGSS